MTAPYPSEGDFPEDDSSLVEVAELQEAIRAIRRIRAEMQIAHKIPLRILTDEPGLLQRHLQGLSDLCGVSEVQKGKRAGICATAVVRGNELYIPLEGVIDIEEERQRLDKELAKSDKDIASLEKRLNNPGFTNRAPAHVVAEFSEKLSTARDRQVKLREARQVLTVDD